MESLEINNFLTIRLATLDVKPFTILIGPQANGKSIVAKLLYFFREFLTTQFISSIENLETKRQLERHGLDKFEQIFPKYTWTDQDFKLVYRNEESEVSISRQGRSAKKSSLKLDYSKNLAELHRKVKQQYKNRIEELKESDETTLFSQYDVLYKVLATNIYSEPVGHSFHRSVFIPASRSFFANLQKYVFSFLAKNIPIDPLIKEFGSVYESSKTTYSRRPLRRREEPWLTELREEIKQETEKILTGQYLYEDDQDWIASGKRKINLVNASSGQQEVLPMLIVLSNWLYRGTMRYVTFFIEEPEAHLFPVSQRRLVGMFSKFYRAFSHRFILTTHSPYVLTALNNLIMASNLVQEKGESVTNQVKSVICGDAMIRFEDVSAYTIKDGVLESILDNESKLIGSSIIDSVSDEFDRVFDKLMEIQIG